MRIILLCSLCLVALAASAASGATTTSISQFGITWTFAAPVEYGQFANGDYWVVGPVSITAISPPSANIGGRTKHGSMINPGLGMTQGYDSAMYDTYGPAYSSSLNRALGVSAASPLTVQPGSSLISSISIDAAGNRPQLKSAAVLTVLSAPAPAGSFRPPYFGANKTIRYNESQLDFSKVPRLAPVANAPALATVTGHFQRPWLEHVLSWTGRYCHPSDNMPDYGRDMAKRIGDAMLVLLFDYTDAQKEQLLIGLTQYGIDLYAILAGGGVWEDLGGHMHGRKLVILLAGLVLGDSDMLDMGVDYPSRFQEDRQTWIVTQYDVGRPLYHADGRPRDEYIQSDVGVPEWGEQHTRQEERDGRNWSAYYRRNVGHSILAHVLAANILGLREQWNWEPLFLYIDRYWEIEKNVTGTDAITTFHKNMWNAYRGTTHTSVQAEAGPDRTIDDVGEDGFEVVTLDGTGSSSANGPITGYLWSEGATLIGTSGVQMTILASGAHTITLQVTDSTGATGTDTVVIDIRTPQLVCDAGDDVEVVDADGDGFEIVTLDGSGSFHRSGTIAAYLWSEGVQLLGTTVSVPAIFFVGEHTVTLKVTDSVGEESTDTVRVTIVAGGARPGDCDGDGDIDLDDFVIFKGSFGRTDASAADGDCDGDGDVDIDDFVILKQNFGT